MAEKDLHTLQREFRNIVAPVATAEISEEGAARSAGIIVELDEKMHKKRTEPIDLFRATLSTSQLIERWSQQQQRLAAGSISSVNDVDTVRSIQEKFAGGNLPKEEIMRLTKLLCVASPSFGANTAMEVLSKLRGTYADISLQSQSH